MNFDAWGWPQYVFAGMLLSNFIVAPLVHDTEVVRNGFSVIFCTALTAFILYSGGFWK